MKVVALLLAFVASTAAFAPSQQGLSRTTAISAVEDMPGNTAPFKVFDPFDLATLGSEQTLSWFRAAELKHSRVAMLATTGYIVQAAGFHFPGMLSSDVSFESLSTMKPLDAWAAVPEGGKSQIIAIIGLSEIISECTGTHYTKGGDYPEIIFPPIDFTKVDADTLKVKRSRELNNGRLAMIAIISFCAAANIPGSVPLLAGSPMF